MSSATARSIRPPPQLPTPSSTAAPSSPAMHGSSPLQVIFDFMVMYMLCMLNPSTTSVFFCTQGNLLFLRSLISKQRGRREGAMDKKDGEDRGQELLAAAACRRPQRPRPLPR
ncbi:hypothetical protein VPH35_092034 [Triticum aestivum]